MENSTPEPEGDGAPLFGDNLSIKFAVEIFDVMDDTFWYIVVFEGEGYEVVRDGSECILKVI